MFTRKIPTEPGQYWVFSGDRLSLIAVEVNNNYRYYRTATESLTKEDFTELEEQDKEPFYWAKVEPGGPIPNLLELIERRRLLDRLSDMIANAALNDTALRYIRDEIDLFLEANDGHDSNADAGTT